LISAGTDETGALRAIVRIALDYKFKTVFQPVIAKESRIRPAP